MPYNSTLKRKMSLRDCTLAKMKREGIKTFWANNGTLVRKKPPKKVSKSQRNRLAKYQPMRIEFLSQPENRLCLVCVRRREDGEDILVNPSTEVHHKFGRYGENLFRGFVASCYPCRLWPHENPRKARELGLLV